MNDALRAALADLPPRSRDLPRRVLIEDFEGRNEIASALLRYRDDPRSRGRSRRFSGSRGSHAGGKSVRRTVHGSASVETAYRKRRTDEADVASER